VCFFSWVSSWLDAGFDGAKSPRFVKQRRERIQSFLSEIVFFLSPRA
jgi:hypothetical protein